MTWNSVLAVLPAVAAVALFRYRDRWGATWGVGLVTFLLFLPNAPYVVTDLVHLRGDVLQASSDATVYAGILPLYGVFIALGFASYAASLHEVRVWLRRSGRGQAIGVIELGLHSLCAVGVLLGRVARLNTWDTVTQPEGTLARAIGVLSWRASPVVLAGLFVVIWLGHAVTRLLAGAGATWMRVHLPSRWRSGAA